MMKSLNVIDSIGSNILNQLKTIHLMSRQF
jgi:hypothetical protein